MKKEIFHDITSALFLILFVYTALTKIIDYERFVFQMRLAPLHLMIVWAPIIGYVIPIVELGLALGLTWGFYNNKIRKRTLIAGIILLFIFEIYIVILLLSGSHLPCTCGGIISKMSWRVHLLFNGIFIGLGLTSYLTIDQHLPGGKSHKELFAR